MAGNVTGVSATAPVVAPRTASANTGLVDPQTGQAGAPVPTDNNGVQGGANAVNATANAALPALSADPSGQGNGFISGTGVGQANQAAGIGEDDVSDRVNTNLKTKDGKDVENPDETNVKFDAPPTNPNPTVGPPPILVQPPPGPPIKNTSFSYWGDPHAVTSDGLTFNNELTGTFTLLKSTSGDLEVQTTQGPDASGRWPGATLNHQVAVQSGSDVVKFDINNPNSITIDGKTVPLGDSLLPGGGAIHVSGNQIFVNTAKGDVITITKQDGYLDIGGNVASTRPEGSVSGLLGVFDDGNGTNELVPRGSSTPVPFTSVGVSGADTTQLDAFMNSWRVGGNDPAL